ncbi:MAG: hypothetical protein NVSMB56_05370 [Pyrinomonadaceae bacterium]
MRTQFIKCFSFILVCGIAFVVTTNAQQPTPTPTVQPTQQMRERTIAPTKAQTPTKDTTAQSKSSPASETAAPKAHIADAPKPVEAKSAPDVKPTQETKQAKDSKQTKNSKQTKDAKPQDIPADTLANRHEDDTEEAAAVVPYYNNFLSSYRLGPEDVISIAVFNQPNYSKQSIIVPPDGRISYYLIPEGVFVAGKTTRQIQDELTKKLDEYIIDPKVTVSLDKAQSTRYAVVGDVVQPGIKLMTRRLSLTEAISEAGGILQTGDKKKVVILRKQADGNVQPMLVNYDAIVRGKHADDVFLVPGDQVVVPGNLLKKWQTLLGFTQVLSFARTFTPRF